MEKLYTVSKNKAGSWLWLSSWTPYCQIQTKIVETFYYNGLVEKATYDYTVEVRNRFKGLYLIDGVPDELWTEVHDIVHETGNKIITKK